MVTLNRLIAAAVFAVGVAGAVSAATFPSTRVFSGQAVPFSAFSTSDPNAVDAVAIGGVDWSGVGPVEFSAGGSFLLTPLGGDLTNFFLNIVGPDFDVILEAGDPIGAPTVATGPTAEVLFAIADGSILERFRPTGLLRLSGLAGPDMLGDGTVDVEVFLAPVPLPGAATMLLAALAGLALLRRRLRV